MDTVFYIGNSKKKNKFKFIYAPIICESLCVPQNHIFNNEKKMEYVYIFYTIYVTTVYLDGTPEYKRRRKKGLKFKFLEI